MSDVDMTELRRLAVGATPGPEGPWRVEEDPGLECPECGGHDGEHWIVRRSDGAGVAVVLDRFKCSEPGCPKSVPYTDWKTCEEHNPYKKLLGSTP